jgi:GNAT superfamily N-acetyltransferase
MFAFAIKTKEVNSKVGDYFSMLRKIEELPEAVIFCLTAIVEILKSFIPVTIGSAGIYIINTFDIERAPPTAEELAYMYQEAGWIKNPDPEKMAKSILTQSEWFVARDNKDNLLGIGRFITDYVRYAFIVDIIIKEEHRGKGVGKKIMNDVIDECKRLELESVNLWPSEGKVPFYERLGFYALPSTQPHMKLAID